MAIPFLFRRYALMACIITGLSIASTAQVQSRKLPGIINHPSFNHFAPYISFDGNALLFVSDEGEDGALVVSYTSRETDWVQSVPLPKHINHRLTYQRGYALSADGRRIYFTAAKTPVVGGYDIMFSDLKGSTWGEPQNMLVPINSKSNEGAASFSADGSTIYFMRCDKMDQQSASGCSLFTSKKKSNGQWEEPVELPASVNTGNSQTPRIMADNETLLFSSDKMPGNKGGMDLYMTRMANGVWSSPVPLDFINTARDDQFVSVAALGRYLIRDVPGTRNNSELVEFLIPTALRPKGVMKVDGVVKDPSGKAVPAYISVVDRSSGKRVYSGRPNVDGSYMFYLAEGSQYEFDVDPEQSKWTFFSKSIDLTGDKIAQREKVNIALRQPVAGDEIALDMVAAKAGGNALDAGATDELKRLVRVAKANPQLAFDIQVTMSGYREDSVQQIADLTEVRVDTVRLQVMSDSTALASGDTIMVRKIYHNDRSQVVAQQIMTFLNSQSGEMRRFTYKATALPVTIPDEKKFTVKALVKTYP